METTNASDGEEEGETSVSVARGGPIYIPNLVGPLTGVPQFESTLLYEIQDLKAELCLDSSPPNEEDLSIDELKVLTDEELVEMALNNTPKDQSKNVSSSESFEEQLNARTGMGEDSSAALEPLNGGTCCGGTIGTNKSRRRKRTLKQSDGSHTGNNCTTAIITNNSRKGKGSKANKYSIDESCRAKVDELLKIKQKQDQDRAAARLHSLKYLSSCKDSKGGSISLERSEGMTYLKSTKSAKQKQLKPSNIEEHIAVQNPEVVLCIEVYHNVRNWIKTQEFLVLGRQTPTELRDKIYCMTDQVMQKAGKHDPSGYFLIEDVFCNDTRDPSALDYSEPIFDWLRNSKDDALRKWECIISGDLQRKQKAVVGESTTSQLPQFRRADMQKVRFCDLRFRLGAGYLYCHQGDCKHTIVIRDMRLVHPDDVQNRAVYPIVIFQHRPRFQKCSICKIFRATKLTVDDKWTPCNPCYFCNDCYYLLHYSENGSLLYSDFSTFDYLHD